MFKQMNPFTRIARKFGAILIALLLLPVFAQNVSAQAKLGDQYPELAGLFNAFDVTQGALLEGIVRINEDPSTRTARDEMEEHLNMLATMSMSDMMKSGMGGHSHDMGMIIEGPYNELETEHRTELIGILRKDHSAEEAKNAFGNSSALNTHTARVFQLGREFEAGLFEIYLDDSITDKQRAVNAAIEDYLSDSRHSVPTLPKSYGLMAGHTHATAFQTGFPKLSGLLWSNQWLHLAALEAIMVEYFDRQFSNTVPVTLERYWNKVGSESGMTMFPAPNDLPMAPTIAPHIYSFHPQASIIIDNLNMLETIVADILAFPNLEDRQGVIDAAVGEFTNKETNFDAEYDYLLAALRGGIYNQGGPAVGNLDRSERNRSRLDMDMKHNMIMSNPQ
ncbi:MAG: hypothetical protein JKY98_00265 [Gammaproteobacteria bacterium]|nr:hypothetical protein [Gammaproteobacteria bacterium]